MIVLGIESSCDETSVAVLKDDAVLANLISSQDFHINFGGVVPELSSRAHIQIITSLVKEALATAGCTLDDIDAIGATAGPGLIGALLVGYTFARGLAFARKKKFVPVNHIEGHIFSGFLMEEKPEFPLLVLAVSGGHTLLLLVKSFTEIIKLGSTIDDAAGEAFDKVAKMIGLGYPGGPKIQVAAEKGDSHKIPFPIADLKGKYDFSFSGLKTSVLRYVQKEFPKETPILEKDFNDIAASFQFAVVKALLKKCELALRTYDVSSMSLVGGVAANSALRTSFLQLGEKYKKKVVIPDLEYCGDNAAMIASRAQSLLNAGESFSLETDAFPNFSSKYFINPPLANSL
ncbi:MAG: tRNA (adenosine(37)-N6)-threonylcarbamoyltransferase complex transferase subunit TsaD [Ignavibacteriaceae bacterium]|jgi:N6-L-threonylcarbamoyladenine synthase